MYILLTFRDVAVKSVLDQSKYIDVIKEINISKISKKRDHIRKGLPQYSCCDWVWSYNLYLYVIYWYDPHLTGFWYGVITVTTISRFWVPDWKQLSWVRDCKTVNFELSFTNAVSFSYFWNMKSQFWELLSFNIFHCLCLKLSIEFKVLPQNLDV